MLSNSCFLRKYRKKAGDKKFVSWLLMLTKLESLLGNDELFSCLQAAKRREKKHCDICFDH